MKTILPLVFGLLVLTSCGSNSSSANSDEPIVPKQLKKDVTEAIKAAEEKLKIMEAYASSPDDFPLDTTFKKNEFVFHEDDYHVTNLLVVSSTNPTDIYGKENRWIDYRNLLKFAKDELNNNNKENLEYALEGLQKLKYVMVYQLIMSKKPKMAVGGFDSGIIMANIHIIDLDSKKIIHSDNLASENSDNIQYRSNEFPFKALYDDLANEFNKQLKQSLKRKGYVDGILPVVNVSEFSDSLSLNL